MTYLDEIIKKHALLDFKFSINYDVFDDDTTEDILSFFFKIDDRYWFCLQKYEFYVLENSIFYTFPWECHLDPKEYYDKYWKLKHEINEEDLKSRPELATEYYS